VSTTLSGQPRDVTLAQKLKKQNYTQEFLIKTRRLSASLEGTIRFPALSVGEL